MYDSNGSEPQTRNTNGTSALVISALHPLPFLVLSNITLSNYTSHMDYGKKMVWPHMGEKKSVLERIAN